jgi:hypothetical protein
VSIGPSGLDRRNGTVRSSARSHRLVRSQRSVRVGVSTARQRRAPRQAEPLREHCSQAALAAGGRSAHLAGARRSRVWPSIQAEPSGRCPEQSQRAAPMCSCFFDRLPRGDSTRGTAQNTPDAPFWPPNGVSGSVTGRTNHGGDSRSFIFRATALKVGWEAKMRSNEPGCAFSGPRNARW